MGHSSEIFDIKGLEVTSDDDTCKELYHALGEEDRGRVEDIEQTDRISALVKAYDSIISLDSRIDSTMACRATASEPMAIGWWEGDFEHATDDKLESLKKILIEAGFEVKRLEKDRFLSYG